VFDLLDPGCVQADRAFRWRVLPWGLGCFVCACRNTKMAAELPAAYPADTEGMITSA
jgi:hypothetical protein